MKTILINFIAQMEFQFPTDSLSEANRSAELIRISGGRQIPDSLARNVQKHFLRIRKKVLGTMRNIPYYDKITGDYTENAENKYRMNDI